MGKGVPLQALYYISFNTSQTFKINHALMEKFRVHRIINIQHTMGHTQIIDRTTKERSMQ